MLFGIGGWPARQPGIAYGAGLFNCVWPESVSWQQKHREQWLWLVHFMGIEMEQEADRCFLGGRGRVWWRRQAAALNEGWGWVSAVEGSEPPDREHGGAQGPWRAGRTVPLLGSWWQTIRGGVMAGALDPGFECQLRVPWQCPPTTYTKCSTNICHVNRWMTWTLTTGLYPTSETRKI